MLGAAHRPGAVPLRPLRLGDIFDAAFRIIRFNPRATVGAALVVAVVTMAIPVVLTAVLSLGAGATLDLTSQGSPSAAGVVSIVASIAALGGGLVLLQLGLLLVTGLVAHVTHAAATGRKLSLAQAWAATRGKRWRLIGLALVASLPFLVGFALWVMSIVLLVLAGAGVGWVVFYSIVSGLLVVLPASVLFYVRCYYLSAAVLVLEPVGILGALRRSWRLTAGQFWRILGISLVTGLVAGTAGYVLALPLGLVGQVATALVPQYAVLGLVLTQAISTIVSTTFTAPFTSAVTTLQYLDQRMRKEAYDVELMAQAGITGA